MIAFNVVRFRVKPGQEKSFVDAHREVEARFPGLHRAALIKTGDRRFCFVGEWNSHSDIVAARPMMIGFLDVMRDMLEDLGAGLGVTDPVSGEVVVEIAPRKRLVAKALPKKLRSRVPPAARRVKRKAVKKHR